MIELGASGVQMATRFVATEECDAHDNFKKAYIDATEESIELIQSPVGLPGRVVKNEFTRKVAADALKIRSCYRCLKGCNPKVAPFCITEALIDAVNGDTENGLIFVGTNGYKIDHISTVKDVIESLKKEYLK